MLFPDELEKYANSILLLLNELEAYVISDVARRLAGNLRNLPATAVYQIRALNEMGISIEDIQKKLSETTDIVLHRIEEMFYEANIESFIREQRAGEVAGKNIVMSAAKYQIIQASVRDFASEFLKMTSSIGMAGLPLEQAYHNILNTTYMQIASGASDYISSIKRGVEELSATGLQYIAYRTRNDHLDVAVRRAVLSSLKDATNQISEWNAQELGCNGWEVSAHMGARPSHAEWQGRQYAMYPISPEYQLFSDVVGDQMSDANCRHVKWGIFLGITEPAYTEWQLEHIDTTIEFRGKEYTSWQATEQQRKIERNIRRTKRDMIAYRAAGLQNELNSSSINLKTQMKVYREFSNAAKLPQQTERLGVYEQRTA